MTDTFETLLSSSCLWFLKTERRNLENLRSNFSCDVTDVLGDGQVKEAIGCTSWDIWRIFWGDTATTTSDEASETTQHLEKRMRFHAISMTLAPERFWKSLREKRKVWKKMKEAHQRYQQKSKHLAKNDQTSVVTQQLLSIGHRCGCNVDDYDDFTQCQHVPTLDTRPSICERWPGCGCGQWPKWQGFAVEILHHRDLLATFLD